jgi:mRNA interferase RelE/StbE
LRFLAERVAGSEDPRRIGEALKGEPAGLWRYRVGDFRVICRIEDYRVTVLVLDVGNRRYIYR